MGVCVGWTINQDINPNVWAQMRHDLALIIPEYKKLLIETNRESRNEAPFLSRLFMPDLPKEPFEVKENTTEKLVVAPGLGGTRGLGKITPENQSWYTWEIDRAKSDGWCKTNVHYNDKLLFVALMLIEKYAPGTVTITQNDYDFDVYEEIQGWVGDSTKIPLPSLNKKAKKQLSLKAKKPSV